ncbi:MAG: hypothetical protein ACK4VI_03685 [Alphaproteobacteria bacterium]
MTAFPLDHNHNPIPALRLRKNGAHMIEATDTSERNAAAFDPKTKIVSIYATVPVFIRMGDVEVNASDEDHYFPDGVYYDFAIAGASGVQYSHIAVIKADDDGDDGEVYLSEKE